MSIIDRAKAQLLFETNDLEELFQNMEANKNGNYISTDEVVVRYYLNGLDKFFIINRNDILDIMKKRAEVIPKELGY